MTLAKKRNKRSPHSQVNENCDLDRLKSTFKMPVNATILLDVTANALRFLPCRWAAI
jgi:hypothetical protein